MRRSRHLLWLFSGLCLLNFQCEDECFEQLTAPLVVQLENAQSSYRPGDTIWLNAAFDASLQSNGRAISISEQGGILASYLFALDTTTVELGEGGSAFLPVATNGSVLPADPPQTAEYVHYLQYPCDEERCTFRKGLVAQETGTFLLRVEGLGFDGLGGSFSCPNTQFFLSPTELMVADDNISSATLGTAFTEFTYRDFAGVLYFINTERDRNLFLIQVTE